MLFHHCSKRPEKEINIKERKGSFNLTHTFRGFNLWSICFQTVVGKGFMLGTSGGGNHSHYGCSVVINKVVMIFLLGYL